MEFDFSYQNPTRIHFGKQALSKLPEELSYFGKQVLLVYGTGSLKRTGLYDTIRKILKDAGKTVCELSGITSNPTADKVYEGIELARQQQPDLILAVGGGSVLDCAKVVAAGALYEGDFYEHFFVKRAQADHAIPLGTVLTMAGTGSEMNGNAVITHTERRRKSGMFSECVYPVFSILNPELTYTVPKEQMVSGICDILSHILEVYMSPSDEDNLSDDLAEAMMRNLIRSAYRAIENPLDYTARANIMWGATVALNGLLEASKQQDWMVHQIEHQIGAYTDCPHGLGLAAVSANYYRLLLPYAPWRFARFAQNVWGIDPQGKTQEELGELGIGAMEDFFRALGAPVSLRELGLDERAPLDAIADSCRLLPGSYHRVTHAELRALLRKTL